MALGGSWLTVASQKDNHGGIQFQELGQVFRDALRYRKPGIAMSIIPLDVQRRFEQRWAIRFAREAAKPSLQKSEQEKQDQPAALTQETQS